MSLDHFIIIDPDPGTYFGAYTAMILDHFIIIDPDSGTYFGANTAMILDTRKLSEGELETLNEGSDGERGDLASEHGSYIENLIQPHTI